MERVRSNKLTICLFILPALLGYLLVFAFPIIASVGMSFFKWDVSGMQKFLGLKNYMQMFATDRIFKQSIWHVLYSALLCYVGQVPLAILLAHLLTRIHRFHDFFKVTFFVPNMVSSAAIGILWIFIYNPNFGLVNSALQAAGLGNLTRAWLGDAQTALTSVILATCWQFIGYHMIIYLCGIQSITDTINEAAEIDGANAWQSFWRITFPLLAPILKIDAVLVITGSLRIFDVVYVMTGGGPSHASEMIATHMYTRTFKGMQFGYGSAISVFLILLCLAMTVVLSLAFRKAENNLE